MGTQISEKDIRDIVAGVISGAGAGASVPLIGFGAAVIKGTKDLIDEVGAIGILKGPFSSASAGCSAAIILGYLVSLIFKSKPKRA